MRLVLFQYLCLRANGITSKVLENKKADGDSLLYQGMNIIAGVFLVIYTFSLGAFATTGLNAVWVAIGLFTLGRKWLNRK